MALTAKQQQFLDTYVRKHSFKGKGKAKRAEAFSDVRDQVLRLLKSQPWMLVQNPGYRVRMDAADALGEALKFDRATAAFTSLLADLQGTVSLPQNVDPSLSQAAKQSELVKVQQARDAIVGAQDWGVLTTGSALAGDLKVMSALIANLIGKPNAQPARPPTGAQLQEARNLVDELGVKAGFARKRRAEIEKRRDQLRKYAGELQSPSALGNSALQLAGKDAGSWTREDESKATEIYLALMLELSERDQVQQKNFKAGSAEGEIVLAVRRKYKTDSNTGQSLTDEANFKLVVKPLSNEIGVPGFKAGGGASREAMGSVIGDKLQEMLGLDLNVAKTRLAKVDGARIGVQGGGEVCASVQAFVKNGDTPMDSLKARVTDFNSVDDMHLMAARELEAMGATKEDVHSKAVFDLLALHMDRHAGNFIIGGDGKLVPIDHGNILPSLSGLRERSSSMAPPLAVLANTQAAKEKLSPEMVERVERLNIEELVKTMVDARQEMARNTPDAVAGELGPDLDEGIANARRSAEFLKFAARQLTLEEIYIAYANSFEDIFCSTEDEKLSAFARAVSANETKANDAAMARLSAKYGKISDPTEVRNRAPLLADLKALGWFAYATNASDSSFKRFMRSHLQRCAEIIEKQIAAPALVEPKPLPAWTGKGNQPNSWGQFWALGGYPAAKRYGLDETAKSSDLRSGLYVTFAGTGRLP